MCDQLLLLVNHDDYRFVGICEHGTLHISWGHIIVYMTPTDFLSLDYCLDRAIAESDLFSQRRLNSSAILWIFNSAILLKEDEFLVLAELVAQAAESLALSTPRRPNAQIWIDKGTHFRTMQVDNNYKLN